MSEQYKTISALIAEMEEATQRINDLEIRIREHEAFLIRINKALELINKLIKEK